MGLLTLSNPSGGELVIQNLRQVSLMTNKSFFSSFTWLRIYLLVFLNTIAYPRVLPGSGLVANGIMLKSGEAVFA